MAQAQQELSETFREKAREREPLEEGKTTRAVERVTARAPSSAWMWLAGASMAASIGLYLSGRKEAATFVGLWPPTLLIVGTYNKIVKQTGS